MVVKEPDRGAVKRFSSLLAAAAILAIGFLYAGHQHFAALRLGYETEKLRNALTDAKDEQRRLTMQREVATSPARLEQAARQLGMQPMQAAQLDPLRRPAELPPTKPAAETKAASKTSPVQKTQPPRRETRDR
jgi:cell division protein FtsL